MSNVLQNCFSIFKQKFDCFYESLYKSTNLFFSKLNLAYPQQVTSKNTIVNSLWLVPRCIFALPVNFASPGQQNPQVCGVAVWVKSHKVKFHN